MNYIIINALVYISTFCYDIWKNKCFSKTSLIWLLFSFNSFFAIFFYSVSIEPYNNITLTPYVFLYLCIFFSVYPLQKLEFEKIEISNPSFLFFLIYTISLLAYTPFLENIIHIQDVFSKQTDIAEIYDTKMDENFKKETLVNWYDPVSRYFNSVCLQLQELTPILFFYYLTFPKIKKWVVIGLIMAILNPMLYSIALAGRGSASIAVLYILFLYLLFRKLIPNNRSKGIKMTGFIFGGLLVLMFSIMSIARLDAQTNNYDMISWLSLYFGESMLNFNDRMWNAPCLMYGDYSFSFFKEFLGFDTPKGIMACRDYWGPRLGFAIGRFFTYVGDIMGDFGKIGVVVFITIISSSIYVYVKDRKVVNFSKLILIILWAKVLLGGFTTYNFGTKSSSQRLLELFIICVILGYSKSYTKYINK